MKRSQLGFMRSTLIVLLTMMALPAIAPAAPALAVQGRSPVPQLDFQNAMRKLWEDHITWTRLVIVAVLDDRPEKDAALARLLQNQVDIGNAVKPFYGDAAGNQLTSLLKT